MLDHPEKTARLIAALKVAVPFEITLTPEVVKQLQAENFANPVQTYRTVSDLSYAGDEGGIPHPLPDRKFRKSGLPHPRKCRRQHQLRSRPPRLLSGRSEGIYKCR